MTGDKETDAKLAAIRKAMAAALSQKPKNIAEYKRLGAEHRALLHSARPDVKAQWERCVASA